MAAHGFKPMRHLAGGTIRTSEYTIAIDYDTAIYTGDPVKLVAAGGGCGNHVAGTGSAKTGVSGYMLDTSDCSNAQAGWKLIRKVNRPGNAYGAANDSQVEMEVWLNEPHYAPFTAGI